MRARPPIFRKFFLLVLLGLIIWLGIYVLRQDPEERLKKAIYPRELRVMTYNIHHGIGSDEIYSLSRIARIIRDQSPHLVCLNEVDCNTERTYGDDQARKIAAELGMDFTFAKNFAIGDGWYGNAILSRYPIKFSENRLYQEAEGREQRGLLHTIIRIGVREVHFYGTHFSVDSLANASEASEMLDIILDWGLNQPVIVAGDLNMEPNYQRIRELTYYLYDIGAHLEANPYTYPSTNPTRRIDYIFCNDKITPKSVYVVNTENARLASDHLPVIAQFQFKD